MLHLAVFVLLLNLTYGSCADSLILDIGHGFERKAVAKNTNLQSSEVPNKPASIGETPGEPQNAAVEPQTNNVQLHLNNNPFRDSKDLSKQAQNNNDAQQKSHDAEIQNMSNNNNKPSHTEQKTDVSNSKNVAVPNERLKDSTNKNITSENKSISEPFPVPPKSREDDIKSGALLRGFYVFLGLSAITMFYFLFRSYRLRHGSQPSTTVKKYGITARRSDMEMRPLELDDEDDDTLFEIGNQSINR